MWRRVHIRKATRSPSCRQAEASSCQTSTKNRFVELKTQRIMQVLTYSYPVLTIEPFLTVIGSRFSVKQPIRACSLQTSTAVQGSTCCVWPAVCRVSHTCGCEIAAKRTSCSTTGTTCCLPAWDQMTALWNGEMRPHLMLMLCLLVPSVVMARSHVLFFFPPSRHPRCSPFNALRVLLVFEKPEDLWAQLLTMSGASSVRHFQADKDGSGTESRRCPSEGLICYFVFDSFVSSFCPQTFLLESMMSW